MKTNDELIKEIESLSDCNQEQFEKLKHDVIKNLKRQSIILEQSDKRQRSEYDELQARLAEVNKLNREIEETQREVIITLGSIADERSHETGNHVRRVAGYSKVIATAYGMSEEESELLKLASPMHDVGKIAIPDAILNKPGPLSEDEFTVMKRHAELGYEMLRLSNREILKAAAIVAFEHHEKFDGSGYPRGLKGKDIHIYGRITAVADVFDALGSNRCYKSAWKDERIFELFQQERSRHFDPDLIDIFFDHKDDIIAIRESLRDEL